MLAVTSETDHPANKPELEKILPSRKEGSIQLKLIEFFEAVVDEVDPPGG